MRPTYLPTTQPYITHHPSITTQLGEEQVKGIMDMRVGEWRGQRKKKKKKTTTTTTLEEEEEEKVVVVVGPAIIVTRDPLEVFGMDIMTKILSYLNASSVASSTVVSRDWHAVASSDLLWASKCDELWLGKAHIPRLSQTLGLSKLEAYSLAVTDGKRARIRRDDLCDHAWEFHFTKAAPEYWRNLDPYWSGALPLMHRYFHQDGSSSADPDDKVWGGHECSFSIVTSLVGEGEVRSHYVRMNRWSTLSIQRKNDWSWEMSNNLCCYSSLPDAQKEGGTGPLIMFM